MKSTRNYARLLRRLQAVIYDGVIISMFFYALIFTGSYFEIKGEYILSMFGFGIFALEPLLVTTTGGTLGQHIVGIQVQNKKTGTNLNIFSAVLRFFVKLFLSWLSIISVLFTRYHQGVHDLFVGSVVVLDERKIKSEHEYLSERIVELPGYTYPSILRKTMMILTYNVLLFLTLAASMSILLSDQCLISGFCSETDQDRQIIVSRFWFISMPILTFLCLKSRIWGCRRIPNSEQKVED